MLTCIALLRHNERIILWLHKYVVIFQESFNTLEKRYRKIFLVLYYHLHPNMIRSNVIAANKHKGGAKFL